MNREQEFHDNASGAHAAKLEAIEQVVREVLDTLVDGNRVDDEEVIAAYPELMPELADRLQMIESIAQAREAARADTPLSWTDPTAEFLDADLEFLRRELTGYEVVERIEHAGQGIVYKAIQQSTNRMVAIKVLLDGPLATRQQRQRFNREVKLISRLHHPNIVTLYDSGQVRGRPFFAMEFVDGVPIDDYVLLNDVDLAGVIKLVATVCQAVHAAHQQGVVHRDLKPSNILVDLDGEPHVLDFGLAKDIAPDDWRSAPSFQSMEGQALGTLPYASPEQVAGTVVDERTDVYSLGVLLYELLSGAFPYPVDGPAEEVRANILGREPMSLRRMCALGEEEPDIRAGAVDDDIEAVVHKALRKEKGERYQSVGALADDLERYLNGDAVEAKSDRTMYLLRKTVRRYRTAATITGAFVVLLLVSLVVIISLWQRSERIARMYERGLKVGTFRTLGGTYRDLGRVDRAIAMLEQAIAIAEDGAALDDMGRNFLVGIHHQRAQIALEFGDFDNAIHHHDCMKKLVDEALENAPKDLVWIRNRSFVLDVEILIAQQRDQQSELLELANKQADLRRSLVQDEPGNCSLLSEYIESLLTRAKALRKLNRFDEAYESYEEAHQLGLRLMKYEPGVANHVELMSFLENHLAVWHMDQRTPEDDRKAREHLERVNMYIEALPADYQRHYDVSSLREAVKRNRAILAARIERQAAESRTIGHSAPAAAQPARHQQSLPAPARPQPEASN